MKKKEPNFKWWQRLIFEVVGVRRVDILKLALARLEYRHESGRSYFLCHIVFLIMADLGMVDYGEVIPVGLLVHQYIPRFEDPCGGHYWDVPWWAPSEYDERKAFLLELIEHYKNDKKRFQINIYHHG